MKRLSEYIKRLFDIYIKMNVAVKVSIWFMICSIMQKGISTITVPIFTRLLTTAEYGTYSLYLSWFNILTIATSLNLYYGVFNNALNKMTDSKDRDKYISSMQGLTITLTLILALIYVPFQEFWSNLLGLSTVIIWLLILELMVEPALRFWSGRQRFEFNYKKMVLVTMLKSILNPVLGILMVVTARSDRATARIISVVIVEAIFAGTILIIQFYRGRSFFNKNNWKYALGFNVPLLPHYLSGTLLNQADRVMIQKLIGKSEVGIYSVAYNIGMLMQLFINSINASLTPWMYDKMNRKDYDSIRRNSNKLLLLLSGSTVCVLFFVPEIVMIFASSEYRDAIYVVPPIACSVYFIFLHNLFAIPQMYFEQKNFMSVASTLAAVLNIILNLIFIPIFGYFAAGYTTVACYIIYSLGHYIFCQRVCEKEIHGKEVFDKKTIFAISLFVIFCSIVFNFMYRLTVIRYLIALIILICAVWKKKEIINIVREIKRK